MKHWVRRHWRWWWMRGLRTQETVGWPRLVVSRPVVVVVVVADVVALVVDVAVNVRLFVVLSHRVLRAADEAQCPRLCTRAHQLLFPARLRTAHPQTRDDDSKKQGVASRQNAPSHIAAAAGCCFDE